MVNDARLLDCLQGSASHSVAHRFLAAHWLTANSCRMSGKASLAGCGQTVNRWQAGGCVEGMRVRIKVDAR